MSVYVIELAKLYISKITRQQNVPTYSGTKNNIEAPAETEKKANVTVV